MNLQNSTVTIMVPEDTTDEQLQLVIQKFEMCIRDRYSFSFGFVIVIHP